MLGKERKIGGKYKMNLWKKNGKKEKEKKLPNVNSRSNVENIFCIRTTCQIDKWYHLYFHLQHKNLLYKHILKMSQLKISLTCY